MTCLQESETFSRIETRRRKLKRIGNLFGVHIASESVCSGHCAPLDFVYDWCYQRPSLSVILGPRGGGKSYLAAFGTLWDSLKYDRHGTRILGGSKAQSQQIYEAIVGFSMTATGQRVFQTVNKESARCISGSDISMLAASSTSVRGPHVPSLKLDEIDEIDPDIREAAMGMCMERLGVSASVAMMSTWHRLGGPMGDLIERGQAGEFPYYHFCAFDILERCPESRSGPNLENCPACPLVKWCHDTTNPLPKAKRSNGHYAIDSLIQKVKGVSLRVFEADYLCLGPKADGLWFGQFDEARHVAIDAEYDPSLPVHIAIDSGVYTGAVLYQVVRRPWALNRFNVFGDYLSYDLSAEANARAILALAQTLCHGRLDRRWTDPAGGSRNPVGPTVMQEYARCGLPLVGWPVGSVADGLAVVESSLRAADDSQRLYIHPRCKDLVRGFKGYRRAKRNNQWVDWPEDPQHPFEDLIDALRGGMVADDPTQPGRPQVTAGKRAVRALPGMIP